MTAPNPPDSTSSSTPPGTPPPAATAPPEFRYGNDAPEYLRGKTAQEAAALLQQTVGALQQYMTAPTPAPAPQPTNQFTPPAPDDYVTGAALQQVGTQYLQQAQQAAQQYATPAINLAASGNLDRVRERYAKEWAKYGPEIEAMISRIPKTDWSIDTLSSAVKVTLAGHLDDLVNDRVAQFQSSQDPALRSSGANGSTAPSIQALDQGLTDVQREKLRRQGITEQVVAEFAAKKGITPQKWYETAGKHMIGEGV